MSVKCKNCGAVLPESLVCEYCGADNSPGFRAKFNNKGYGTIEYDGKKIVCYISEIEIESLIPEPGSYRCINGRLERLPPVMKRTFTIKEW